MTAEHGYTKLQYGSRFGAEVFHIARKGLHAARMEEHKELAARYTQWFHEEPASASVDQAATEGHAAPTVALPLTEIADATRENLRVLGEDTHSFFAERLPRGHRMRKAVRASIVAPAPYLGSCKFGEVFVGSVGECRSVIQMNIANFYGSLNTNPGADFFRFSSLDFDQMFYGVHMLVDRQGNFVDFDRTRGRNGIAFKTRDVGVALNSVASASTGLSVAALNTRLEMSRNGS